MGVSSYKDLAQHVGHEFECVFYDTPDKNWNVSLECLTCHQVIVDFDTEEVQRLKEELEIEAGKRGKGQ